MQEISVNSWSLDQNIADPWAALCRRAAPNVFMHPAALRVAHATGFAQVHMLLAWLRNATPARLVGAWAMQRTRITPFGPSFLGAPAFRHSFLSNPVIDPEFMHEAVAYFLDAIARDAALPHVLRLRYLDADSESYAAIMAGLRARGANVQQLSGHQRAFVSRESGQKHSGSTRKKLHQDWNRLCALGPVEILNDRSPGAVKNAFETYLAMERGSWKGTRGTALLCDPRDATFARDMIAALAAEGSASVALLEVGRAPAAAQVVLYCGCMAYTWKTAFDAKFSRFSPGSLLVDKLTGQLLASEGIDAIESCSPEGGFMERIWSGRRATVDLLADLGAGRSFGFSAVGLGEGCYQRLRGMRNRLRARDGRGR